MRDNKMIAVVIPAHNEERNIQRVLTTMPAWVDFMVVVNDASQDDTAAKVEEIARQDQRVVPLSHPVNQGVGGAIATGYKWCRDQEIDCAVVMAGDGQMDPGDLQTLIDPVIKGKCDYAKGNRLIAGQAWKMIPRIRYLGNVALSLLTKVASGYWSIADSQCGYTAANRAVLKTVDWDKMYKRYGQPNDLLVTLNINFARVQDVVVAPVYGVGEASGIRISRDSFKILRLLFNAFWRRMFLKYIVRDCHPLVFLYLFSFGLFLLDIPLILRVAYYAIVTGIIPTLNFSLVFFCTVISILCSLWAMFMDMAYNRPLSLSAWNDNAIFPAGQAGRSNAAPRPPGDHELHE